MRIIKRLSMKMYEFCRFLRFIWSWGFFELLRVGRIYYLGRFFGWRMWE